MMLQYERYQKTSANPSQLIFLIHGYGSNKDDLITLAPDLAEYLPDALFISPNAVDKFEDNSFHIMKSYQWFSLRDRSEEAMLNSANKSYKKLEEFIISMCHQYNISLSNVALIGFSQGTMISLHLSLRLETQIGCVIGYSGLLISPSTLQNDIKSKPPVLIIHGTEDTVVPIEQAYVAYNALKSNGVPVEPIIKCSKLGHGIDKLGIKSAGLFLKKIFAY